MPAVIAQARLTALRERLGERAVLTDPQQTAPYLTDHRKLYRGAALAVVEPSSVEQVQALLHWCNAQRIGVVPQGGNTSYCGGATPDDSGTQVVLSMRRLNRIRAVDAANFSLIAEAGCTLSSVQGAAAAADRLFPLSLGSEGSCQIGGNLSTNAGGTAVLRYGMTRDLVLGVEAVMADGELFCGLVALRKDNTGYDLRNLLIGSEGTLAVITAASLKLFPAIRTRATAWVSLPDPASAIALLGQLRQTSGDALTGCELAPQVALQLVLQHVPGTRDPGGAAAPWYLLVELSSSGEADLDALLEHTLARAIEEGVALDAVLARSLDQRKAFWKLRETIPEAQRAAGGSLKHDIAVPVACLPAFIERGAAIAARLAPEGYLVAYGHAGDGNLHFNLNQREGADEAAFLAREPALKRALHDLAAQMNGSISAEHGIGQLKVEELERYAPAAELTAMRRIKQALDPNNILNPGKVLRSRS
ncbi:MAG: FAD-binding oxidoreductase [Nevskiaceae bacterium]|jgi:D-lactate dehydrogenase (cytochrome)|nr:FAD-binding oxidoreductase [Nevskiaceae bacterium]